MNSKLHAVTDAEGRPIRFFMTAGQVGDYTGAAALLGGLPKAEWLLADRGYDADWFRDALKDKGIKPCIPAADLACTKPLDWDGPVTEVPTLDAFRSTLPEWQRHKACAGQDRFNRLTKPDRLFQIN